jgi:hypothetical protein
MKKVIFAVAMLAATPALADKTADDIATKHDWHVLNSGCHKGAQFSAGTLARRMGDKACRMRDEIVGPLLRAKGYCLEDGELWLACLPPRLPASAPPVPTAAPYPVPAPLPYPAQSSEPPMILLPNGGDCMYLEGFNTYDCAG